MSRDQMLGAIIGLADAVGVEGVGGENVRAGVEKRAAIAATIVGPGQVQKVVVALLVVVEGEVAAIIGLGQPLGLDHRAIGAVLDRMRFAAAARSVSAALMRFDSCADAEQVADGVGQLGPVERVEMEMADAAGIELAAQFGRRSSPRPAGARREDRRGLRTAGPSSPGSRRRTGRRTCASARRWRPAGCPARSRRRCPRAATRSRKRKKQSAEKKNWVIARSAPASILRLQIVEIAVADSPRRDGPRDRRRPKSRTARSSSVPRPARRHWHSRPDAARIGVPGLAADRRAARRCGARRPPNRRGRPRRSRRALAPTQVRCAAGVRSVSRTMPLDGGVGALAGRSAGAIGDRDEARLQRRQRLDRAPQRLVHRVGLGREEFEADGDVAARLGEQRRMVGRAHCWLARFMPPSASRCDARAA